MSKPKDQSSVQDFGNSLPDSDAKLTQHSELVEGFTKTQAEKACEEVAEKFDGFDVKVEYSPGAGQAMWDCQFKHYVDPSA